MIFLLTPFLAAALPGLISAAGSFITRQQSRGDINRQNAYNHPAMQVARLREAGLPYGALTNNSAGNQSALPQTTDGGLGKIAEHATTRMQLKQLEILEAERRSKEASADKDEAMTAWLLSHTGEDSQNTNLTQGLKLGLKHQDTIIEGGQLANRIQRIIEANTPTRLGLENSQMMMGIEKAFQEKKLVAEHTEGAKIDNRIKSVVAAYQERMSNAEFRNLLKRNNLLDAQTEGTLTDNDIKDIRLNIENNTQQAEINTKNIQSWLTGLTYDKVKEEFKNYQEYQAFVDNVQDWINNPQKYGLRGTMKAILSSIYTATTDQSGYAPGTNSLLNNIK